MVQTGFFFLALHSETGHARGPELASGAAPREVRRLTMWDQGIFRE